MEWDTAAGQAVLAAAGGEVVTHRRRARSPTASRASRTRISWHAAWPADAGDRGGAADASTERVTAPSSGESPGLDAAPVGRCRPCRDRLAVGPRKTDRRIYIAKLTMWIAPELESGANVLYLQGRWRLAHVSGIATEVAALRLAGDHCVLDGSRLEHLDTATGFALWRALPSGGIDRAAVGMRAMCGAHRACSS